MIEHSYLVSKEELEAGLERVAQQTQASPAEMLESLCTIAKAWEGHNVSTTSMGNQELSD